MTEPEKPVPAPDSLTEGYWESLRTGGKLAIQWCAACDLYQHFPEPACGRCGSVDLIYKPVSGRGEIYSFVIPHRTAIPGFSTELPYVVAWIELPEQSGLRVLTNVVDTDIAEVAVGMPVELVLERRGDWVIPQFTRAS